MAARRSSAPHRLATALGWASVGLGVPPVAAPGRFTRALGIEPSVTARRWAVAVGVRELVAAAGIAVERPRPVRAMYARVAGDGMDAALLAAALNDGAQRPERVRLALAAVGAIATLDALAAVGLARAGAGDDAGVTASATAARERDDVQRAWRTSRTIAELEELGTVRATFSAAPGDRGTEIRVAVEPARGGGPLSKLRGTAPDQRVHDLLRRFKQELETGEIARSDGAPSGHTARSQPKQRPAQPLGRPGS